MASLNRTSLMDAASFNGDAVRHISGSNPDAFKGFNGIAQRNNFSVSASRANHMPKPM